MATEFPVVRLLLLATLGIALGSADASAQRPAVNPAVETVVSGGHWHSGKMQGHYRVIIVQEGREEVRRVARLEWILEPSDPGPQAIIRQLDLTDRASVYALAEPLIEHKGDEWLVRFKAARAPLAAYDQTVAFGLGAPGMATFIPHP